MEEKFRNQVLYAGVVYLPREKYEEFKTTLLGTNEPANAGIFEKATGVQIERTALQIERDRYSHAVAEYWSADLNPEVYTAEQKRKIDKWQQDFTVYHRQQP